MLIGKGLIASTFKHYSDNSEVIVFASGVSNSGESNAAEYEREFKLLQQFVSSNSKLIYFSTCSVIDDSLKESSYIRHKLNVEKYISENFYSFIIFRLPIVVGKNTNPFTLTNFLFNKIKNNEKFTLFDKAHRYLIDIDDLGLILSSMINAGKFDNQILDVCFNNKTSILELIAIFEKIINKKALYIIKESGSSYTPNNTVFMNYLEDINFQIQPIYNNNLIEKYYFNR
ncbi:MAG: hypothetical protein COW67_11515 [Flavobacteriales bacterium CG18_big_fil_WC_8_21_14_2_50_32_9]|nr:MAG: hypothetical protein COW67_11515 [Flavobacteriales bacterium CG18_big_fil_WC_8_21_14_2_50_32_9]PIY26760.1 MAG: hypothetical protein COZ11_01795 [Deltaproteobacteria bacterium CG_4_10_14_3_um_filter_51_14]